MAVDLFAGIAVKDFAVALAWYERLLGSPPSFFATETEAIWEVGEHQWVYILLRPESAGHAMITVMVADLDARVAEIAERGMDPAKRETYAEGASKAIYLDPDGNEFCFGGTPQNGS